MSGDEMGSKENVVRRELKTITKENHQNGEVVEKMIGSKRFYDCDKQASRNGEVVHLTKKWKRITR